MCYEGFTRGVLHRPSVHMITQEQQDHMTSTRPVHHYEEEPRTSPFLFWVGGTFGGSESSANFLRTTISSFNPEDRYDNLIYEVRSTPSVQRFSLVCCTCPTCSGAILHTILKCLSYCDISSDLLFTSCLLT